jgi:3-isopropylmalate/(R)-2-methylmalate dehydratase small subunit
MAEGRLIKSILGRGVVLPGDDIDTDRIIPARYMKSVTFEGLGRYAFYDERFDREGKPKDHPLNDPRYQGGSILIVNRNFGCGSSREHAPQSLMDFGIRAFIGESYAEIFAGNCTALGLPTVSLSRGDLKKLMVMVREKPDLRIGIDLEEKTVSAGDGTFQLDIPETYRQALVQGTWDSTAVLLEHRDEIVSLESRLPYRFDET